jgi:hypothetical protein
MRENLSGRKYFVRYVVALVCGVAVGAGAWFIIEAYFPDVSPYWGTALGAAVMVLIAPIPNFRGVAGKPGPAKGENQQS